MYADPTRAGKVLDWHPHHDLDDIVAHVEVAARGTHLTGYDGPPLALTLTVEPTEQRCNGARIESQPMSHARVSSAAQRVGLCQLASIDRRHVVIVVAMHHQQRSRPRACGATTGRKRRNSRAQLVEQHDEARADGASARMFEEAPQPVVKMARGLSNTRARVDRRQRRR